MLGGGGVLLTGRDPRYLAACHPFPPHPEKSAPSSPAIIIGSKQVCYHHQAKQVCLPQSPLIQDSATMHCCPLAIAYIA